MKKMKIYFDTEFTGLQKNTTLISIGLISENGDSFYAEFSDYDKSMVNEWIQDNVIDNLLYDKEKSEWKKNVADVQVYGEKQIVKRALKKWLSKFSMIELCSDVHHYDMVLFVDIFGDAFSLPDSISPCCIDINQKIYENELFGCNTLQKAFDISRESIVESYIDKIDTIIDESSKHNAFYDATIIKAIDEIIELEMLRK